MDRRATASPGPLTHAIFRLMGGMRLRHRIYRRVIVQMAAGRPIKDVFADLAARSERRYGPRDPATQALAHMARGLREGRAISQVFADWFPKEDAALLAIGETTGRVPEILQLIIETGQSRKDLSSVALKGLISPLTNIAASFAVLWYLSDKVMPVFAPLIKGHPVTGLGAVVVGLAHIMRTWAFLIGFPVGLVALGVAFVYSQSRWTGRLRRIFDRFPPWSFTRRIQGALWLSNFAALSQAGMQEKDAMEQMLRNANPYVRERLRAIRNGLLAGRSVGETLARSGFAFPDTDTVDDLTIIANYPDYAARMNALSVETLKETESAIRLSAKSLGIVMEALSSLLMVVMMLGIFSILQTLMTSVAGA